MKDLIVLVADKNMEAAIHGLLAREASLGIVKPSFDIRVHPERDPGVLGKCQDYLRPFLPLYGRALVMFDRVGCGSVHSAEDIRWTVKNRLDNAGWYERNHVVVLDPELEIWVWSDSPHVARALKLSPADLQQVLAHFPRDVHAKPVDPKGAMESALKMAKLPRSSAIYAALASSVSLNRCRDENFSSLKSILTLWFPRSN